MCGRYSLTVSLDELARVLSLDASELDLPARYNAAPTQKLPVITNKDPKTLQLFRWGLIPFWAKDPAIGNRMINARGETLLEKPSFRTPMRKRRCMVPSDGFYEWKKTADGKVPHHIRLKGGTPFTMAGLWETWKDGEGVPIHSFTLITTDPNELVQPLHNRMPAILRPADRETWLNPDVPAEDAIQLIHSYDPAEMEAYPVSTLVNSPRNDGPEILAQ